MTKLITALVLIALVAAVHMEGVTIELKKMPVHEDDAKFLSMATGVRKPIGNQQDMIYYGEIGFGKNTETGEINWAPVIFDTGSSWLWVATKGCDCPGIESGIYVDMSETDFKSADKPITLAYGEGGAKGELGNMTIYLSEEVSYDNQAMIAIKKTYDFGKTYSSGIFGLSHKAGANNHPTLLDNLFEAGKIDQKLFTVALRDEQEKSAITFGEVSETFLREGAQFSYVDLNLQSTDVFYYTLLIDEVKLGEEVSASNHYAIADTGTSLLCIPPSIADKFFETAAFSDCTNEEGTYVCPCDTVLPSLEFTIGGQTFEITSGDYLIEQQGQCIVGIETITPPGELIVLGDIFLRKVVAVFDLGAEKIGFAHAILPSHK